MNLATEEELKRYTLRLCEQLKVEYNDVFTVRNRKKVNWVRYLLVNHFAGEIPQKEIAAFLGIRKDSLSAIKNRFPKALAKDYKFRQAVAYLEEVGFDILPTPPRTKDVSDKLDRTLYQIDRTIEMLKAQKDEIYKIKENLPKVWE